MSIIFNDTHYDDDTPAEVINFCEQSRRLKNRLRIWYGITKGKHAGLAYDDEFETTGYVGRSTGSVKIPLIIHNARSLGGGSLRTNITALS